MLIKNRASGKEYEVDADGWSKIIELKQNKLFKVLDNTNLPNRKSVTIVPDQIKEFQIKRPKKIVINKPEKK